jgi:hypothetical protein
LIPLTNSAPPISKAKGTYILGAPGFVDALPNPEGEKKIASLAEQGYRVVAVYYNKTP